MPKLVMRAIPEKVVKRAKEIEAEAEKATKKMHKAIEKVKEAAEKDRNTLSNIAEEFPGIMAKAGMPTPKISQPASLLEEEPAPTAEAARGGFKGGAG